MRHIPGICAALLLLGSGTGCVRHRVDPRLLKNSGPPEAVPPGMVVVEVVSANRAQRWDVHSNGRDPCTTPCKQWFRPDERLLLKSHDGDHVVVAGLGDEAAEARRAVVVAEESSTAKRVNGIVFTTLGGMGAVTGITLTAVGCSNREERSGLCTAGLITGGVSLPVTGVFIWMLATSGPKAHVLPVHPRATSGNDGRRGDVDVTFTPNGLAGTF